jgi:hypothetical protein
MNKILFLFFPIFLFAQILKFPYEVSLKKDQNLEFFIYRDTTKADFKFRWTLYINNTLTILAMYDKFPYQFTVFKNPLMNLFKITLQDFPPPKPYFLIQFVNFNGKIAVFKIFLFNGKNLRVELKGKQ